MRRLFSCIVALVILSLCAVSFAEDSWICPFCGTSNTTNFCTNCGNKKPDDGKWVCPKCGMENEGKFCGNCGAAHETEEKPEQKSKEKTEKITVKVKINGKKYTGTYEGELANGKPNGKGTFKSKDGSVKYTGTWKIGAVSGKGTLEAKKYTIHFNDSKGQYDRTGYYKGSVKNGLPDGQGYFQTHNSAGTKWDYDGKWKKGKQDGRGRLAWYDEKDKEMQVYDAIFADGDVVFGSIRFPAGGMIQFVYVSTNKTTLQFELQNTNKKKAISSYEVTYFTKGKDGKQNLKETKITLKDRVDTLQRKKSPLIYINDYSDTKYLYFTISKVTYSDGTVTKLKPLYLMVSLH